MGVRDSGQDRHEVVLTPMRQAIARRMADSKRSIPHFYESAEIEVGALAAALERTNEGRMARDRVTFTAALICALAQSLLAHRALNAVWDGDSLQQVDAVNIGVAVVVDGGLIAPAILHCERLTVREAASQLVDLLDRARAGRVRSAEWTDATFTLSNLGMYGVDAFTAIVVPPQVAILAVGRAIERAVVRDGVVTTRRLITATVSADHRAVDGVAVAKFLDTLARVIAAPDEWVT